VRAADVERDSQRRSPFSAGRADRDRRRNQRSTERRCGQQAWHRNYATNPFRLWPNRGILSFAEDRRGLSAIAAALALWSRRFYLARIAAAAQVTIILLGWALAQFPHLVTPDVTIQNAAASESTLRLLLLVLGAGAIVLLPSLFYLFRIFKGQEQR
jgi:cytochrome bd-type quinol oxidase subunit 2